MPCYHPITAYQHRFLKNKDSGKHIISFKNGGFAEWEEIHLPCGQCIGCRLERSRQWAVRCVHEALLCDKSCFITLTYSDDYFRGTPRMSGSLKYCKKDFVDFMKRLRKHFSKDGVKVRFFHCGEYGEKWQRPHHHAILFGVDFKEDRVLKEVTKLGYPLFTSDTLQRLWHDSDRNMDIGFVRIGECTFETVAYVARYVVKKINGESSYEHYYGREPEYITMSRRPGIGYDWLLANPEIYNYDEIVIRNGIKCKPPAYYDKKFEEIAPDFMKVIKDHRKECVDDEIDYNRLNIKEEYKLLVTKKLIRSYEKDN